MKIPKIYDYIVLGFMGILWIVAGLGLVGCSDKVISTPLYSERPAANHIVIIKPPMLVSISGEVDENIEQFTQRTINQLKTIKYKDYHFNENLILQDGMSAGRDESINSSFTTSRDHHTSESITTNPQQVQP